MKQLILVVISCTIMVCPFSPVLAQEPKTPADLQRLAADYYNWRNQNYPVASSDAGLHTWDNKLTDYSLSAVLMRRLQVKETLAKLRAMPTANWSKDDRIDWLLFRSQLDGIDFFNRVMDFEETDPQTYVNECSNGIFSLLKKEYDTPRNRALAATARLKQMPFLIEQGKGNLTKPVRLYAQLAIDSARSIDSLFNDSLMTLAKDLSPAERNDLVKSRDAALVSIHGFADWLEKRLPGMVPFKPMGEDNYNYLLKNVYLLPLDAKGVDMLGQAELARYRALESWLPDPSLADPNPARSASVPKDQEAFLKAYESRETEMVNFLKTNNLVTLPAYLGRFEIRQLPEAFKPTSPGGFMNAPGVYDKDDSGFYFIPTYNPQSKNFYIRAAIEDPRPILGHEGIPGHFLQISIANHLQDEIRRQHSDGVLDRGLGALWRRDVDAYRSISHQLARPGTDTPSFSLSRGAYRRGREPADRQMDFRSGRELFHGSRWTGSRVGYRRSRRRGRQSHAEDHIHGWEVADHALAGKVSRQARRKLSPGPVSRRLDQEWQPAALDS